MQYRSFYFGLSINEFWSSTLADVIIFVNANAAMETAKSRDQWSVMRYQTTVIAQMLSDGKSKIQLTDILRFEDEKLDNIQEPKPLTEDQSDKLNAAYQRYLTRKYGK